MPRTYRFMPWRRWGVPMGLVLLLVAGAVLAGELPAGAKATPDPAWQKQWEEGLAYVSRGRTAEALRVMDRLAAEYPVDEKVKQIHRWLGDFQALQTQRADRARTDYEKYVGWIKEEAAKGLWRQAIWSCGLAFNNVEDHDAFRGEAWLADVVQGVVAKAREYEQAGKWFEAARMYARLGEMFPLDERYRKDLDRCQTHIRVEFTYQEAAEGEVSEEPQGDWASDWKAVVSNITPAMARDAFRRINDDYLKDPSFKDMVVSALEHMLLVVQESKLSKVFPKLGNAAAVEEFVSRVNVRLEYAQRSDELTVYDLIAVFDRVLRINQEIELLPQTVLIYEFVHGALQPLDRFTDMIWPSDVQEFNKHTQGRFSGVGIQIRKGLGEPIKVITPLEDTPAYQAGIQPGDLITKIDGRPTDKITITQAVREITGVPGSGVTLTIQRPGREKEFSVTLTRQEITIFTIKGFERDDQGRWKYMIDPENKIGYVRMTNFTEGTIGELQGVIRKLRKDEGMRGLIFDLRGNPGGPLKSAVEVADLFLDGEKPIVSTKDRRGKDWAMSSTNDAHFVDFPMSILVNPVSASASEIVVGALQVHHRALVVGERTYGKGSVQQVLQLANDDQAYLKLTTALYYLPNGRCLHRDDDSHTWGADPDVEIKLVPKEIIKVNELRLKKDILKGAHQRALTDEEIQKVISTHSSTTQPASREGQGPKDGNRPDDSLKGEKDETKDRGEIKREDSEQAGEEKEKKDLVREDPNDWPETDPQLEAALMLMRVRLVSDQPWPDQPAEVAATPAGATGS